MKKVLFLVFFLVTSFKIIAQTNAVVKNLHYKPFNGNGFVCVNPKKKFNRALYGSNSAFRIEAGDFPEFALYLPGMGGNCKIGLLNGTKSKWLSEAQKIQTVYQDGAMHYKIQDELLGDATLVLKVTATYTQEALLIAYHVEGNKPKDTQLTVLFGGITGKKFSRDGDIGADPESSFYLKAENCSNNKINIAKNTFNIQYLRKDSSQVVAGLFPDNYTLSITDAIAQKSPFEVNSYRNKVSNPCLTGIGDLKETEQYLYIQKGNVGFDYSAIPVFAKQNEVLRQKIANTVQIQTPDTLLNPMGQALSLAADAIWDSPTYMHGAVAWRMRLPAWRGPYIADVMGQHDRAKTHFSAYAKSQVGEAFPLADSSPDSAMHLARQLEKIGKGIFTEGYICRNPNGDIRAHHYDMNLVYIDQLLNHFNWTGDTTYLREMWSVIKKHLAWEKHNFDADDDGLFDAYCCIWASDALQYSGGGVTHSTAYNYRAFRSAASLAKLLGENSKPYQDEADKIYKALQEKLWLDETGCFAEYKDALGLQLVHPSAGLWTIYHAIDAQAASPKQQYQMTEYVQKNIPHIPFRIPELNQDFYQLSTTNWQPYTWSINNVALGENLHTSLACWQAGNKNLAYEIWRNTIIESLYTSASPGGFEQLSSLDAIRGELYRDFGDGIGMAGRSLVEGLFGIRPQLLEGKLLIEPGLPNEWAYAKLKTSDIEFNFKKNAKLYEYDIKTFWNKSSELTLRISTEYQKVKSVVLNGNPAKYTWTQNGNNEPILEIKTLTGKTFVVKVLFEENKVVKNVAKREIPKTEQTTVNPEKSIKSNVYHSIDLSSSFNDKVTRIFKNKYLSPRLQSATLQLPVQGIGNWCYPLVEAIIDDSGLRQKAKQQNGLIHYQQIPFATPADTNQVNIAFASKWDNFPDTLNIRPKQKIQGHAVHLLMAGTTNPMQSQMANGKVVVHYESGEQTSFELHNPNNWWPIEQDYFYDGKAFQYSQTERPTRLLLKTGDFIKENSKHTSIKGFSNAVIEGGAANVYQFPILPKPIKSIQVISLCNDVIIGLMALTVQE
ncbi:DUF4450 domain-containing protein [Arcicella aquatica]|uniref:DUF4450 domain-containing protein n=1 Tax=Arcicella aquatica TaxID=217141 RepID=A0ABU5QMC9_9BACT|nr:DUF4450 domain-containing protein [Arcicella aquatica]MEA5258225.1 DUF4450 domain-containing protein [Arcicella aquatica]